MDPSVAAKSRSSVRPFLKWAGGKQWLAPILEGVVPGIRGTYREPFLGGGAVFFRLRPSDAVLSDSNGLLVETFQVVRDNVDALIDVLERYPHDQDFYEEMRKARPPSPLLRAARLIYLNKTAFNGLYRENGAGNFNVPFGSFRNPTICQPTRLRAASSALRNVTVVADNYSTAVSIAGQGDLVYLDPPYITGHRDNGFRKYSAHLFTWDDHVDLAKQAEAAADRGAFVIASNADHDDVAALYPSFVRYRVDRSSLIGGGKSYRRGVSEAVFSSEELGEHDRLERVSNG